jgi:lipoprotein-anchoring transpeptidase ErfK/SrfK
MRASRVDKAEDRGKAMIKISHILTGALAAGAIMCADWATAAPLSLSHQAYSRADQMAPVEEQTEQGYEAPAQFKRQLVAYTGSEAPGTIIIDTPNTFLYLVQPGGKAIRYGIGVGRDGFRWSGVQTITKKAEWPDWTPPAEMIQRQPYLPRFMAGGPTNPLGARAMYLGNTVYRIHGTNAPSTIGQRVSSGCIRLTNEDVTDLASRVNVGTKVVVINADQHAERSMISAPVSLSIR